MLTKKVKPTKRIAQNIFFQIWLHSFWLTHPLPQDRFSPIFTFFTRDILYGSPHTERETHQAFALVCEINESWEYGCKLTRHLLMHVNRKCLTSHAGTDCNQRLGTQMGSIMVSAKLPYLFIYSKAFLWRHCKSATNGQYVFMNDNASLKNK